MPETTKFSTESSSAENQPDFIIIGAPKSGTTSVYHYLQQHPQIFMSPLKEPHFFLFDGPQEPEMNGPFDGMRRREMVKSWDAYQALFKEAPEGAMRGEASIRYLYSEQACHAMRKRLPRVKLVIILRNPADRAFSSYRRDRRHRMESCATFEQALTQGERREQEGWFIGTHQSLGYYARYLKPYMEMFDRQQIKICLYDDLRSNPPGMLRDLFGFLGVDTGFEPDLSIKYNVTGTIVNPFWRFLWMNTRALRANLLPLVPMSLRGRFFDLIASKPVKEQHAAPMPEEVRRDLMQAYREDILVLQELVDRDLSVWLPSEDRP